MESDIFSILKDESYEDNRWTRLIADRLGINVPRSAANVLFFMFFLLIKMCFYTTNR